MCAYWFIRICIEGCNLSYLQFFFFFFFNRHLSETQNSIQIKLNHRVYFCTVPYWATVWRNTAVHEHKDSPHQEWNNGSWKRSKTNMRTNYQALACTVQQTEPGTPQPGAQCTCTDNLKLAAFCASVGSMMGFGNADTEMCRSVFDVILRVSNDNKGGVVGPHFWPWPRTVMYCWMRS